MLNEIMKSEELRERRLVDLYEEGILESGDEVPYTHREETYVSLKEKNGFGDQEFSTKGLNMKWQAIGVENIDGNKCLKLIAKEPVFDFELQKAEGCVYGSDEMHNICSLFATGAGALKGRSITIEDVNQLLEVVVDEEQRIIYQKGYKKKIGNKTFLKEYFLDKEFYTPESYLEGKQVRGKIIKTFYFYRKDSIKGKEYKKDIVFKDIPYWIASSRVFASVEYGYAYFGLGYVGEGYVNAGGTYLFYSSGICGAGRQAIRPILYLKSNETIDSLIK